LLFYQPLAANAAPRSCIFGHLIGVLAGYLSLVVFGLTNVSPNLEAVTSARVGAVALSLALTLSLMTWLDIPHALAGATTLIVALGLLRTPEPAHHPDAGRGAAHASGLRDQPPGGPSLSRVEAATGNRSTRCARPLSVVGIANEHCAPAAPAKASAPVASRKAIDQSGGVVRRAAVGLISLTLSTFPWPLACGLPSLP
jgi:hypothetical protein